jgi:hypothetical protein
MEKAFTYRAAWSPTEGLSALPTKTTTKPKPKPPTRKAKDNHHGASWSLLPLPPAPGQIDNILPTPHPDSILSSSLTSSSTWVSKSLKTSQPQPLHRPGNPKTSSAVPCLRLCLLTPRAVSQGFPVAHTLLVWSKHSQLPSSYLPMLLCPVVELTQDPQPYTCVCLCQSWLALWGILYALMSFILSLDSLKSKETCFASSTESHTHAVTPRLDVNVS